MHLNVEIKAKCKNPGSARNWLIANHADFKGTDLQTDTYFNVFDGRLKHRQGNIENSLIHYKRNDQEGPKDSEVTMARLVDGEGIKSVLTQALGEKVEVKKVREIYFIDNVKFHLDELPGLGCFIEIEAIDAGVVIGKEELLKQFNYYMEQLQIGEKDLLMNSYSDMMLAL